MTKDKAMLYKTATLSSDFAPFAAGEHVAVKYFRTTVFGEVVFYCSRDNRYRLVSEKLLKDFVL